MKNDKSRLKSFIIMSAGALLVVFAIGLLLYDRFSLVKDEVFTDIAMQQEEEKLNNKLKDGNDIDDTGDDIVDDDPTNNSGSTKKKTSKKYTGKGRYLGYLSIPKINLYAGVPWKDSSLNNVEYGVYTLPISNYPDMANGNLILAAHSGNSNISFFRNLWKLKLGDVASVSYNGKTYSYKIVDIYYVEKTGTVQIKRDNKKTVLTLITCTKNSSTQQTVYILELYAIDGVSYG